IDSGRERAAINFLLDELSDRRPKGAVLAKHLLQRRVLRVPQMAQFGCAGRDDGVRSDGLPGRGPEKRREHADQRRDLPQQFITWKDFILRNRYDTLQFLEPPRGKELARAFDAKRDGRTEIRRDGLRHKASFNVDGERWAWAG